MDNIAEAIRQIRVEANRKQAEVDAVRIQGAKEVIITAGVAGMREAATIMESLLAQPVTGMKCLSCGTIHTEPYNVEWGVCVGLNNIG